MNASKRVLRGVSPDNSHFPAEKRPPCGIMCFIKKHSPRRPSMIVQFSQGGFQNNRSEKTPVIARCRIGASRFHELFYCSNAFFVISGDRSEHASVMELLDGLHGTPGKDFQDKLLEEGLHLSAVFAGRGAGRSFIQEVTGGCCRRRPMLRDPVSHRGRSSRCVV